MLLVNKLAKAVAYFVVRLLTAISLALLALLVTSPAVLTVIVIMDAVNKIPSLVQGRYLLCWLIVSAPFFVGFNIYTDVKVNRPKHQLKNNKQNSNNK
jgi:hypothetical protein